MNTTKQVAEMTDLEFVDHWIEHCTHFISPILFRELNSRGLYNIVNMITGSEQERKMQARARMSKIGKYVGDPEIERIAGHIDGVKKLQARIAEADPTDFKTLLELNNTLKNHLEYVRDYLK